MLLLLGGSGHGCLWLGHRSFRLRLPIAHSSWPAFRLHLGLVFGSLLFRAIGEGSWFTLCLRAGLGLCLARALGRFSGLFGSDSLPRCGLLLGRGFLAVPFPRLGPLSGTSWSSVGNLGERVFGHGMLLVSAAVSILIFLAPTGGLCAPPTIEGH